jgi:hypothetical protein
MAVKSAEPVSLLYPFHCSGWVYALGQTSPPVNEMGKVGEKWEKQETRIRERRNRRAEEKQKGKMKKKTERK